MKVIKRIFEKRLQKVVELNKMQMEFMPERGMIDAMFTIIQLTEKYEWQEENCQWCQWISRWFLILPREVIWLALRKKGVVERE